MVESIPVPTIVMNKHNAIISYNHLVELSLGENIKKGKNIHDVFSVWETDNNPKIITAAAGSNQFVFMCNPLSETEDMLLIGLEISALSELKSENKELKNLNRELDAIIENSYDGIYITDSRGVTWKTDSAIERITGIPKEYYIGKNVNAVIKRGILKSSVTHKVVKQQRSISLVQKNYAGKETLITGTPVFNEEGDVDKVVTNIRDLSDLNELQAELSKVTKRSEEHTSELQS